MMKKDKNTVLPTLLSLIAIGLSIFTLVNNIEVNNKINAIEVERLLDKAKDFLGDDIGVQSLFIGEETDGNNIELAYRLIRDALVINPKSCRANRLLGIQYHKKNKYAEARFAYNNALKIHPDEAELWSLRGFSYYKESNYDSAITEYKKALSIDSTWLPALDGMAYVYISQEKWQDALRYCRSAIISRGSDPVLHWQLAKVLLKLGKNKEAIGEARKTLSLMPELIDARRILVSALQADGQEDEANRQLTQVGE